MAKVHTGIPEDNADPWADKINFDRIGLRRLGTALLLAEQYIACVKARKIAVRKLSGKVALRREGQRNGLTEGELQAVFEAREKEEADRERAFEKAEMYIYGDTGEGSKSLVDGGARRDQLLIELGGQVDAQEAEGLSVSSFRFGWWHLYEHQILVRSLKDRKPGWNSILRLEDQFDSAVPISRSAWWGAELTALEQIFIREADQALGLGDGYSRALQGPDKYTFAILVSDLVAPPEPKKDGRKQGSSKYAHFFEEIEQLYLNHVFAGLSNMEAADAARNELGIVIVGRNDATGAANEWVSTASDKKRSALNTIVSEMERRLAKSNKVRD